MQGLTHSEKRHPACVRVLRQQLHELHPLLPRSTLPHRSTLRADTNMGVWVMDKLLIVWVWVRQRPMLTVYLVVAWVVLSTIVVLGRLNLLG